METEINSFSSSFPNTTPDEKQIEAKEKLLPPIAASPTEAGSRAKVCSCTTRPLKWIRQFFEKSVASTYESMKKDPERFFKFIASQAEENPAYALFLIHYLQKAANWSAEANKLHSRPTSPLSQEEPIYHRTIASNTLLSQLEKSVLQEAKKKEGVELQEDEIFVINHSAIKETLQLTHDVIDLQSTETLSVIIPKVLIDICGCIDTGKHEDGEDPPLFLFIDDLLKDITSKDSFAEKIDKVKEHSQILYAQIEDQAQNYMQASLNAFSDQEVIDKVLKANQKNSFMKGATTDFLRDSDKPVAVRAQLAKTKYREFAIRVIRNRLKIACIQEVKEQPVLMISKNPHNKPLEGQEKRAEEIAKKFHDEMDKTIGEMGHTPTMLQARTALVALDDASKIINTHKAPILSFYSLKEENFSSYDDFQSRVTKFKTFGTQFRTLKKPEPHPISLLASADWRQIDQLAPFLDVALQSSTPQLQKMVNSSLNRLTYFMNESVVAMNQTDINLVSLYHELITEEVLLLLNLTKPYEEKDFQNIFLENREQIREELLPLTSSKEEGSMKIKSSKEEFKPHLKPKVIALSSGMSCANAILRTLIKAKGSEKAKLGIFEDTYYETVQMKLKKRSIVDKPPPTTTKVEYFDQENSFANLVESKPDLVFSDLHPGASKMAKKYQPRDLNGMTQALLRNREGLKEPLTLAIDITLDKLHSKELETYLLAFEKDIEKGKLNIVLFRSAQKMDQLGVDKVNAGYMQVFSRDENFKAAFEQLPDQLSGLDYQALCHLHKSCSYEIHEYLKIHYKNAAFLHHKLEDYFNSGKDTDHFFKLTPMSKKASNQKTLSTKTLKMEIDAKEPIREEEERNVNSKLFFIELQHKEFLGDTQLDIQKYFILKLKEAGIQSIRRDSFVFNETAISDIGEEKIRFSIGNHSEKDLKKMAEVLKKADQDLKTMKDTDKDHFAENLKKEIQNLSRREIRILR